MHRFALATLAALALTAAPVLAAEPSPLAGGKAVFEKKCATCHTLDRSLAMKADYDGWKEILARMVKKGAALDKTEFDQVLAYLGAKSAFESRCNTCHDLQRPLTAIKDPGQWLATVTLMAAKKPGVITEADAGAIALYLSLVTPAAK
jgi:cytochrome c5